MVSGMFATTAVRQLIQIKLIPTTMELETRATTVDLSLTRIRLTPIMMVSVMCVIPVEAVLTQIRSIRMATGLEMPVIIAG